MTFAEHVKKHYETCNLSDKEYAKFWLIERYKNKVSRRLLNEHIELQAKGKKLLSIAFEKIIYKDNPFLAMIPKDD